MFVEYNPNPKGQNTGDCVIRAMTKALKKDWESAYIDLAVQGYLHSDMPSSNHVWDAYLRDNGFNRYIMPNFCSNPCVCGAKSELLLRSVLWLRMRLRCSVGGDDVSEYVYNQVQVVEIGRNSVRK